MEVDQAPEGLTTDPVGMLFRKVSDVLQDHCQREENKQKWCQIASSIDGIMLYTMSVLITTSFAFFFIVTSIH